MIHLARICDQWDMEVKGKAGSCGQAYVCRHRTFVVARAAPRESTNKDIEVLSIIGNFGLSLKHLRTETIFDVVRIHDFELCVIPPPDFLLTEQAVHFLVRLASHSPCRIRVPPTCCVLLLHVRQH